jgi:hypothetical protein
VAGGLGSRVGAIVKRLRIAVAGGLGCSLRIGAIVKDGDATEWDTSEGQINKQ